MAIFHPNETRIVENASLQCSSTTKYSYDSRYKNKFQELKLSQICWGKAAVVTIGQNLFWSSISHSYFLHVCFNEIIEGAQKWEREFGKVLTQLCGSNLIRSRTNWSRQKWSREKNEVISSFICSENASLHVAIMHHMKKLF